VAPPPTSASNLAGRGGSCWRYKSILIATATARTFVAARLVASSLVLEVLGAVRGGARLWRRRRRTSALMHLISAAAPGRAA
jgi:hypothetical protein